MAKETEVEMVETPTQVARQIKLPDGKIVELEEYLVWLGNTLLEIKKSVV